MSETVTSAEQPLQVLLYSDDRLTREQMRLALGRKLAADLPMAEYVEFATGIEARKAVMKGGFDLLVLDGEATPEGGMGLLHQLKEEMAEVPPAIILVAREQDAWLASWSRAEAISAYPIDPVRLPQQVAELARKVVAAR